MCARHRASSPVRRDFVSTVLADFSDNEFSTNWTRSVIGPRSTAGQLRTRGRGSNLVPKYRGQPLGNGGRRTTRYDSRSAMDLQLPSKLDPYQPQPRSGARCVHTPVFRAQPSRQPIRPGAVITLGQATASAGTSRPSDSRRPLASRSQPPQPGG